MAESSNNVTTLKLVISKATNKVLFAEANKDFVDFLLQILSLPAGAITKAITSQHGETGMIGCLPNLYQSLQDLSPQYLVPGLDDKTTLCLLRPETTTSSANPATTLSQLPSLFLQTKPDPPKKYYVCYSSYSTSHKHVADYVGAKCPCGSAMTYELKYVAKNEERDEDGYVKGVTSYMVMDDLRVLPSSGVSSISLLKDFGIFDVSTVQEKVVSVGFDQGVILLKALLQSKTVLTDIFLGKMAGKQPKQEKH